MFKKIVYYDNFTNGLSDTWTGFLSYGLISILVGILILLMPELVAVVLAFGFFTIGFFLMFIGWKTRKLKGYIYEKNSYTN